MKFFTNSSRLTNILKYFSQNFDGSNKLTVSFSTTKASFIYIFYTKLINLNSFEKKKKL